MTDRVYNTAQIADAVGVTVRTIRNWAKAGDWKYRTIRKRGAETHLYPATSLPEDIRLKLAQHNNPVLNAVSTPVSTSLSTSLTAPVKERLTPAAVQKAAVKADLVRAYVEAKEKARRAGKSVVAAADAFTAAYNAGLILTNAHQALGDKSRQTLERWTKTLRDSDYDCTALAETYGKAQRGQTKVTQAEAELLLQILLDQRRFAVGTAINLTKITLGQRGLKSPSSPATLRRFAARFKQTNYDTWTLARGGEKELNDKVLPYIVRDAARLEVGDVLIADGHRLNAKVINPFTGKPCRPALIAWQDWASRDLVGYSMMVEEDIQAIHLALYRAILRLGKRPKCVYLDNGRAFKAKVFTGDLDLRESGCSGLYARLGIMTTFAQPYHGQSKIIERFFGTMGASFEKMLPSYVGPNALAKPARLARNEKFMASISPERVISIEEACACFEAWLDGYYRAAPHRGLNGRTPGEVFTAGRGQGIDPTELRHLLMHAESRKLHRNGVTHLGAHYWHESLYGLQGAVTIRFDLHDLSHVYVYDPDGEYLCRAERLDPLHPMLKILKENEKPDYQALKERMRQKKALARQTKQVVKLAAQAGRYEDIEELPWNHIATQAPELIAAAETIRAEHEPEPIVPNLPPETAIQAPIRMIDPTDMSTYLTDEQIEAELEQSAKK